MPLYMDIHSGVDATDEDVAAGHLSDLEAQDKYGVRYLSYWFNRPARTLCCLVEAPDPAAAAKVHTEAHGLVADKIVEVEREVVEAFLGGSTDAGLGRMVDHTGQSDGGFRTILFTDVVGSTELTQQLGDAAARKLLKQHDDIARRSIEAQTGRVVKHTGDGCMAAFSSASAAIQSAIGIQFLLRRDRRAVDVPLRVRIGISAGEPVDEGQDLFGAAVQLARRVCDAAPADAIYVSNVVRELCVGKEFSFAAVGATELKGFPEPVPLYAVDWSR